LFVLPVFWRPRRCRRGSAKIEYALVAALIGIGGLVATAAVGDAVSALMRNTAVHLRGTPPTEAPPVPP
jgi:Flp pilus assembly pilin Flp